MNAFPGSPTIVLFHTKHILGWVFILQKAHLDAVLVNLFVNERYRGCGFGECLIEEALKDYSDIALAAHDEISLNLFTKFQKKYPKKVHAFDWWKHRKKYDSLIKEKIPGYTPLAVTPNWTHCRLP